MDADRLRSIKVSEIHLRDDVVKRTVNREAVEKLIESIQVVGLRQPICVRPVVIYKSGEAFNEWELLAGRHRLEAVKYLGWKEIDASTESLDDTRAELAMIDENMARKDLEPAELVYASSRKKVLYEILFPETAHGGDRKSSRNYCDLNQGEPDRFTKSAADLSGKSERTIQMAVTIGDALGKESLSLVGTSLNTITELDALRKIKDRSERRKLMDRARAGEDVSAKDALNASKPKKQKSSTSSVDAANDNNLALGGTSEAKVETTSAPEVAEDKPAFFPSGPASSGGGCEAEPHKQQRSTAPDSSADAQQFEETEFRDIAADVIERFGRENMPYLLTILEGNPRKLAAAIRRQL